MIQQSRKATGGRNYLVRFEHKSRKESRDLVIPVSGAIDRREAERRAEGVVISKYRHSLNEFLAPEARALPQGMTTMEAVILADRKERGEA